MLKLMKLKLRMMKPKPRKFAPVRLKHNLYNNNAVLFIQNGIIVLCIHLRFVPMIAQHVSVLKHVLEHTKCFSSSLFKKIIKLAEDEGTGLPLMRLTPSG